MKKLVFISIIVGMCLAAPVVGYPITGSLYDADEIVYLPVPPNLDYTNHASGTIDASGYGINNPLDYTIVVENKLDYTRWKEFLYDLTFTSVNPLSSGMDFHIDFSITNPAWLIDSMQPQFLCQAYWGTLIAGTPSPPAALPPPTWRVVGWPGNNQQAPVELTAQQIASADYIIDLGLTSHHPLGVPCYDWNPEWVSLSFSGYGFILDYEFTDWCVPEPTTILLLGLGSLLLRRRRA